MYIFAGVMSKNKAIWLARLLFRRGRMTKESILDEWRDESEDGLPMRKSTFYDNRRFLQERYGIVIEREGEYYFIAEGGRGDRSFYEQILGANSDDAETAYRPYARGKEHTAVVMRALDESIVLAMRYAPFDKDGYDTTLSPYCIRRFRGRSYVVGHSQRHDAVRTFAFDRIERISLTGTHFRRPASFSAKEYFRHSFSVYGGTNVKPEHITIEVSSRVAAYLRSMPIHASQSELAPSDSGRPRFEMHLWPTPDFVGELLSYGAELCVISPTALRQTMKQHLQTMINQYD